MYAGASAPDNNKVIYSTASLLHHQNFHKLASTLVYNVLFVIFLIIWAEMVRLGYVRLR